jgi:cell division protein FtsB
MEVKNRIVIAAGFLLLASFLFVIGLGKQGAVDLYQLRREREQLEKSNSVLREQNEALYKTIRRLKEDMDFVENIARTELGMTRAEEMVILKKKRQ